MEWGMQALFSYLATIGFGIVINIPRKGLTSCGFVGMCGWITYLGIRQFIESNVLANLLAALVIGVLSIVVAHLKNMPAILFNIPSLVPLVPGGQAYRAVRNFALGQNITAIDWLVQVGLIAGAISMGFFLSELVGQIYLKIKK